MRITESLAEDVGIMAACTALNVPRATFYRQRQQPPPRPVPPVPPPVPSGPPPVPRSRPAPPLALSAEECQEVLAALHSPRFVDATPYQVWAELLDEGVYLCSVRTMYRLLEDADELRERRNQLRRPAYQRPELLATGPNQVWSWDITKLKGPHKGNFFSLYVILDIYSRYVVGWMLAHRESQDLAKRLIAETLNKQGISPGQLTLHADRGPSPTAQSLAQFLATMAVTKSHSRPRTCNDNPYSEAQFKTLKYHPTFPERFGSFEDARAFCVTFFTWYNTQHRHSSLALLTPEQVHYGRANEVLDRRGRVLEAAFKAKPRRFKGRLPKPRPLPEAVWINPPAPEPPPSTSGPETGPTDTADRHAANGISSRLSRSRCRQPTPPDDVPQPTTTEGGKADEARESPVRTTALADRLPKPRPIPEAVRINPPPPDPHSWTCGPGTGSTDTADRHAANGISSRLSRSRCRQPTPPDDVPQPTTTEGGIADEARENRVRTTALPDPLGPMVLAEPADLTELAHSSPEPNGPPELEQRATTPAGGAMKANDGPRIRH